jgi:hypothetical protein
MTRHSGQDLDIRWLPWLFREVAGETGHSIRRDVINRLLVPFEPCNFPLILPLIGNSFRSVTKSSIILCMNLQVNVSILKRRGLRVACLASWQELALFNVVWSVRFAVFA